MNKIPIIDLSDQTSTEIEDGSNSHSRNIFGKKKKIVKAKERKMNKTCKKSTSIEISLQKKFKNYYQKSKQIQQQVQINNQQKDVGFAQNEFTNEFMETHQTQNSNQIYYEKKKNQYEELCLLNEEEQRQIFFNQQKQLTIAQKNKTEKLELIENSSTKKQIKKIIIKKLEPVKKPIEDQQKLSDKLQKISIDCQEKDKKENPQENNLGKNKKQPKFTYKLFQLNHILMLDQQYFYRLPKRATIPQCQIDNEMIENKIKKLRQRKYIELQ